MREGTTVETPSDSAVAPPGSVLQPGAQPVQSRTRRILRRGIVRVLSSWTHVRKRPGKAGVICVFKPDRLGDFVLSIGAISYLRRTYGADRMVLVVSQVSAEAAQLVFPDVRVVAIPLTGNSLLKSPAFLFAEHDRLLRSLQCDRLVCLRHHRGIGEELILSRIEANCSIGVENTPRQLLPGEEDLYTHSFDLPTAYPGPGLNELPRDLEAHRRVLESVLGHAVTPSAVVPKLRWLGAPAENLILVAPFGSTPERDFPEKTLSATLKAAVKMTSAAVILSGAPHQTAKLDALAEKLKADGIDQLSFRTPQSTAEYFRSVAMARAVISVETATAHLAVAFDKPAVLVIGGGQYGIFAPWTRSLNQRWVAHPLPCFDCRWFCKFSEPRCITELPAQRIIDDFRTVWRHVTAT